MPKELLVDPQNMRKKGEVAFPKMDIHAYDKSLAFERASYGDPALKQILRHMMLVREFESMLMTFKAKGSYGGVDYTYKGPAHLSIGQEAAAVGSAFALSLEDQIFGSHRSHGEFLAKALAAIETQDADFMAPLMQADDVGPRLDVVEKTMGGSGKELSENFVLFGLLSEIFMRSTGFNGGMGGSMHAFYPPLGIYPNNAIVGASAGIAAGAALYKKRNPGESICVTYAGDGSTGCGPVWEAMNFAAMAQFKTLWNTDKKGALPVLFIFNNNFYAMGGQTMGETMGWDRLSRIGAGINPDAMHGETVDGTNPLAVADAVRRKRDLILAGEGPALLDIECYRYSGHSTSDTNAYRSREELKLWDDYDPIVLFSDQLVTNGVLTASAVDDMRMAAIKKIERLVQAVVDETNAPSVDISSNPTLIGNMMFSDSEIDVPSKPATLLAPIDKAAPVRQISRKARFGLDENGVQISPMRAVTLRDGLFEAILHHMTHDEDLIAYGEECREWGGAFGVYRGLSDILPHDRLFNTPISEAAIVATAVGYAMSGGRALIELMYADFIGRAGDEIFNQLAKWQAMSAGQLKMPVVLRCSVGSKYGAQHSQDWTSMVAQIPGLKVVYPATPYDAKGLMATALSSSDPVVFFESQRSYDVIEKFHDGGVPEGYYRVPFGVSDIKRVGEDLTILTIGPSLYLALAAADELQNTYGISTEVIDARTLVPFNYDQTIQSVSKTGRLIVVSESSERGSFAMTLSSNVTRYAFDKLKAAPRVLGCPNWIVPGAEMEDTYFPQVDDVLDIVATDFFPEKKINRKGIRTWDDRALAGRAL